MQVLTYVVRCVDSVAQTASKQQSGFDANTLPESNAVLDLGSGGLWFRVEPGGVVVLHSAHLNVIVVRGALPRAFAGVRAGFEKFLLYRFEREILIAFDDKIG